MPKNPPPPSTIGINPLDQLVSSAPAMAMAGKARQKPLAKPDRTVLTVTVPSELAEELEQIIAVTPGIDLDTLATEALTAVLERLKKTRAAKPSAKSSAKGKAKGRDAANRNVVVIVGE